MNRMVVAIAFFSLSAVQSAAVARPGCFQVVGQQEERVLPGNDCGSPVGFCLAGSFKGSLNGRLDIKATSLTRTLHAAESGTVFSTGDITFDGRALGRRGTLTIRESATLDGSGRADVVALYTVIGGSGELSGARGSIRLSGWFDFETGNAATRYEGDICLEP
jgi:Protein of unknown function (DUF3224)